VLKKTYSAENIGEFVRHVAEIKEAWFEGDPAFEPWFRGQARAYWKLLPGLYRDFDDSFLKKFWVEDELREDFIVRAPILSETKPADNEWEWYFLMQHYAAPTRLLDWTEGALIGLYFAVRDNPGFFDACVWVLDPYTMNDHNIGKWEVLPPSSIGLSSQERKLLAPWLPNRFAEKARLTIEKPVAIYPTHIARRISTQRSCFTVHGTDRKGIDRLHVDKGELIKIVIPSYWVPTVRKELIMCGIDEVTIFPDMDGLGRAVREKWKTIENKQPHKNVLTRLRRSKVAPDRIGVFAITGIKKGTPLFVGDNEEMLWLDKKSLPKQPKEIVELYDDFGVERGGRVGCPPDFNRLTMPWYLNEPKVGDEPNVMFDEYFDFHASRDIKKNEELTARFPKIDTDSV
jgi:hypothetical protein